jgi:hypothetical protein
VLTGSGGITLVPRLHEALDRFLEEENLYGHDLIASVLAGVAGVAALPALLLAAARNLGDPVSHYSKGAFRGGLSGPSSSQIIPDRQALPHA